MGWTQMNLWPWPLTMKQVGQMEPRNLFSENFADSYPRNLSSAKLRRYTVVFVGFLDQFMRPAVVRSLLAYPWEQSYSQTIPKKQTWEWDCVIQCGNGSTTLYVIFLVSLKTALNSFVATTILSLRNLSYSSSLLCVHREEHLRHGAEYNSNSWEACWLQPAWDRLQTAALTTASWIMHYRIFREERLKMKDWHVLTYMVRITKVFVSRVLFDQLTSLLPRHSECYLLVGTHTHAHIYTQIVVTRTLALSPDRFFANITVGKKYGTVYGHVGCDRKFNSKNMP